jgi:hypothetical protein
MLMMSKLTRIRAPGALIAAIAIVAPAVAMRYD